MARTKRETNLKIPLAVSYLGIYAIHNSGYVLSAIETIHIQKYLAGISHQAFKGMNHLKEITVDKENPIFESEDGVLYRKNKCVLKKYPPAKENKEFHIPEEVTAMDWSAFEKNPFLEKVILSRNLQKVSSYAFNGCCNLKDVYLPNTVKEIAVSSFIDCPKVTVHCEKGDYSYRIAKILSNNHVNYSIEEPSGEQPEPKGKWVDELENDISTSALTPFVQIERDPPILIGKLMNGLYYKANVIEKPFLCSVSEAYRLIYYAKKENIPIAYYHNGIQELVEDYRAERQKLEQKKQKLKNIEEERSL